ncbi:MAG: cell division protein FtsQ [Bacteroidota bacterium]
MKKLKKILFISLWVVLVSGLLMLMGFVNNEQSFMLCKSIDVKINQDDDVYFLDKIAVEKLITESGHPVIGEQEFMVNTPNIERALDSHADIAKAEVYLTIDGQLKVNVKQRKPLLRIFNTKGESYYIDNVGKLMPLSDNYTARVLVANGNIPESYGTSYMYSIQDIGNDSTKRVNSSLDELYAMATYINNDKFWKAQIQQIFVNNEKDMELVPLVGDHKIIFGDTTSMDEKFKKLMTFYLQGLNTTGYWRRYSTINLKFKNQIVCTKK